MSLREIQSYVARHGRVTLTDLCLRFDSAPEAMRAMLDQLVRRHRIDRLAASGRCGCCGSAGRCGAGEIYRPAAPRPDRPLPPAPDPVAAPDPAGVTPPLFH